MILVNIMNEKLNNKGFTLVELLAVLVILVAIMGIAIPTISSSMERTKKKQNEARYKVLESAAELYVTDNKNAIYKKLEEKSSSSWYISVSNLEYLITEDDMVDADGKELSGKYIIFTKPNTYKYVDTKGSYINCLGQLMRG